MIITLFIFSLGILSGLNYWQAKKLIQNNVQNEISSLAKSTSIEISAILNNSKTELATISRSPIITNGDRSTIQTYLASELNKNKDLYEAIVWSDTSGNLIDSHGEAGNISKAPFFKSAMNGETMISDPSIAEKTGNQVVAISMPVKNGDRITGMLFGVTKVDFLQKFISDIKLYETGTAHIVRKDGLTIFHPTKDLVNNFNALTDPNSSAELKIAMENAMNGTSGTIINKYSVGEKYLSYEPISGTNWSIWITVPVKETTAVLSSFTWITLITILIVLLIVSGVIFYIAEQISKPIKILEKAANCIASGDLSLSKITVSSKDELGHLALAFETMVKNLRGLVHKIGSSSEQVAASSEELTASAEQSAQAANSVAISISETATAVEDQSTTIYKAMTMVEKIAAEMQQQSNKTQNTVTIVGGAVNSAKIGDETVSTAINQMNNIRKAVDNSANVVGELGEYSKKIGQIVETISNIAGQTNLLALNAAIEAARAGEQGRGFAVVADEVRKLAEQSQEAAKQISGIIGDIQSKTEDAVKVMIDGTQEVRQGSDIVIQAGEAFRDIDKHISEVATIAQGSADDMNQLVIASQTILESMRKSEQISHDISGQTQSISAATEEQSASMEEIASSSQSLATLAQDLQTEVNKFRV